MRTYKIIGPILVLIGILFLLIGIMKGEIELRIYLIIPVIIASGPLSIFGMVILFLGASISFFTFLYQRSGMDGKVNDGRRGGPRKKGTRPSFEGIVLIGPIPIFFGDRSLKKEFPHYKKWTMVWITVWSILLLMGIMIMIIMASFT